MENEYEKLAYIKALMALLDNETKIPKKVFLSSFFPGFEIDRQTAVLSELKKRKLIKNFVWEDNDFAITKPSRSGILDFLYELERPRVKEKESQPTDNKLRFITETGVIIMGVKTCPIPINTNQYFLCKAIFAVPFGTLVKEIDILELMDWAKDSRDGVYDAMRQVNARVKQKLDIDKLLKWKVRRVFIDYKNE